MPKPEIGDNLAAYYPCSICGHSSPENEVKRDKNGAEVSRCPRHKILHEDEQKGIRGTKQHNKFIENFRKAFVDVNYE